MIQFKTQKDRFKEIRNRTLKTTFPIMFIALIGGILIPYFTSDEAKEFLSLMPFVLIISLFPLAFGLYVGLKRQQKIFESYILTIDNECLIREQHNTPIIKILFSEIKKITKSRTGDFTIMGTKPSSIILIPNQLEDIEHVEKLLAGATNVPINTIKSIIQKLILPLTLLTVMFMVLLYVSKNKLLISISGTWLIIISTWSFINVQKNKNIDKRTKSLSYSSIVLLIIVLSIMIVKLIKP